MAGAGGWPCAGCTSSAPCCRDTAALVLPRAGCHGDSCPHSDSTQVLHPALCEEGSKTKIYQSSPTVWCYSQGEAETGWRARRPLAHRHSPAESPCMWGSPELCRMGPRAFLFQQLGLKVSGAETAWRRQLPGRGRAAWAPSASMFPAPSFVLAQAGERSWFNWQLCLWPGCYEKVFCLPL